MSRLEALYQARFDAGERRMKERVWQTLCECFFQRYVPADATVLDLACGLGEFSRHIRAGRKLAVDLEEHAAGLLPADIEFHRAAANDLPIADATVDVVFVSNFFEHLPDKRAMDAVLEEISRVLRPGGRILALQPNIRYAADRYWDFYDHHLPLSHLSAVEGFQAHGFEILEVIPRFLPWSTKSLLPKHPVLIRLYLRLPVVWRLLGRQFFLVARKR